MKPLILWFVEANIAFIALYLFYRLFLKKDTFFREKRFAFIFGILFAILYPFIDVSPWIQNNSQTVALAQTLSVRLPEITVTAGQKASLSGEQMAIGIYILVAVVFLIRILWQSGFVVLLAIRGKREKREGLNIIHLPKGTAPFSFFGWIFINPDEHGSQDLEEILHHEKAHVQQLHTLDVILSEIVCAAFWINPCTWLFRHAVRENLEYLADNNVIHSGFDQKSYQYHLLRLSFQQTTSTMGNYFNVSQLKNRIIMMNKKKTSQAGLSKYALTLPLFALLLISAYACKNKQDTGKTNEPAAAVSQTDTTGTNPVQEAEAVQELKEKMPPLLKKTIKFTPPVIKKTTIKFTKPVRTDAREDSTEKPLSNVEQMPQFPGGEAGLMKFISENLKFPVSASALGIEGRVTIRFIISKKGEVTNVEVIRGLDTACDEEAVRVVKMMPKWTPGKQDGRNVPVYFTLPLLYKLQK